MRVRSAVVAALLAVTALPAAAAAGKPEIVVAGGNFIVAYNHDGTELWRSNVTDESGATGASFFDFEGDGKPEVLGMFGAPYLARDEEGRRAMAEAARPLCQEWLTDGVSEALPPRLRLRAQPREKPVGERRRIDGHRQRDGRNAQPVQMQPLQADRILHRGEHQRRPGCRRLAGGDADRALEATDVGRDAGLVHLLDFAHAHFDLGLAVAQHRFERRAAHARQRLAGRVDHARRAGRKCPCHGGCGGGVWWLLACL